MFTDLGDYLFGVLIGLISGMVIIYAIMTI